MEYFEVGVQVLGFLAAILGIYFASRPLAQNAIAIIVTVAVVFSVVATLNNAKEAEYNSQLSTQIMRSISPAGWFLDDIDTIITNSWREKTKGLYSQVSTTTSEKIQTSLHLLSLQADMDPAPLAGIAILDRFDYQRLSLVPSELLEHEVNNMLFEYGAMEVNALNADRFISAVRILYSLSVEGSLRSSGKYDKDKEGKITKIEIEFDDFSLKYDADEIERLFECKSIERNIEIALQLAERRPGLVRWIGGEGFEIGDKPRKCIPLE